MNRNRGCYLAIFCLACAVRSVAQSNELGASLGIMHSSSQTATILAPIPCPGINSDCNQINISPSDSLTLEFIFARRLFTFGAGSLDVEFPLVAAPDLSVTTSAPGVTPPPNLVATGTLFFTPSARIRFFRLRPVSPFVSLGGGLATSSFQTPTPASSAQLQTSRINNGALQFGGGIDFATPHPQLVFRIEVRDFWAAGIAQSSSVVQVSPERQHNIFVGLGVVRRF